MLFKITAYVRTPPNRQIRADLDSEPPYEKSEYTSYDNRVDIHMQRLHEAGYDVLSVSATPATPNIDEGYDGNLPSSIT